MIEYKYWIALKKQKGIGPATLKEIYEAINPLGVALSDLFTLTPKELSEEFNFTDKITQAFASAALEFEKVEDDYLNGLEAGIRPIIFFDDTYPHLLRERMGNGLPAILYLYGNSDLLKKPGVAILADNQISDKGEMIAYQAAKQLVQHQLQIISGLARGGDMIAHRAALEQGGSTIAVLPHGLFSLTPPELLKDLLPSDNMLFVSPFYPDTEYSVFNAFNRNRLICAMSLAAYIIEAPVEGGVFEAGKSAESLKVPLYTTEYSQYNENSAGNEKLLKEHNAKPVRGKKEDNQLQPNIDYLLADVKLQLLNQSI